MAFWFAFFMWLGSTILQALLAKPRIESARPSGLDDFQVPTATEGRAVPIFVGKVKLAGSNVTWYGDLETEAIIEKVGGFAGIGGSNITKGYKYKIGVQMVLGSGPDTGIGGIDRVWMGDKVIYSGGETAGDIVIDDNEFFGGDEKGGGLDFTLEMHLGADNQAVSSYLSAQLTLTPRYQNVVYAMLTDGSGGPGYIGNSPNLRNIAFEAFWYPNSLAVTGGKERIGDDANPICFLYELLVTNDDWGVTIPASDVLVAGTVDDGALRAVAEQCFDEGLGFSMIIDRGTTAADLIKEIERHVDGKFRLDLSDGRFKIALARPPSGAVTLFDEDNIVQLVDYSRATWTTTFNEVKVAYADRAKDYDNTFAPDQDLANLDITGRHRIHTMNFPGVKTASVASIIASREMFTLGAPIARAQIRVQGKEYKNLIGDPCDFSWAAHSVSLLPMRISRIKYGKDTNAEMTLDLVEDVFRLQAAGFAEPPATAWVAPNTTAVAALDERLWQIPTEISENGTRQVATLAVRDGGLHLGYDIFADLTGGTDFVLTNVTESFTPTAELNGSLSGFSGTIASMLIDGAIDLSFAQLTAWASTTLDLTDPNNLLLIDDELMWFEGVVDNMDGTFSLTNVHRGALSTQVVTHADNTRVWFPVNGAGLIIPGELDPAPVTINAKLLPRTATGTLAIASAAQLSITTGSGVPAPSTYADIYYHSHFDGVDAATTAVDESDNNHTTTFVGTAQLDTAQAKFGVSSLLLDGNSDFVTVPDGVGAEFGSGDFTLEAQVRFNGDPGAAIQAFISKYNTTADQRSWIFRLNNNTLEFTYSTDGTAGTLVAKASAWNPAGNTDYHVAVTREGANLRLFIDGVQLGNAINVGTDSLFDSSAVIAIGAIATGSNLLNGHIDEVRIHKGFARYTGNFTAPTDEFFFHRHALLAGFDGADGATAFTSEDRRLQAATFVGNAELDTAEQQFGSASLLLDGAGDYVSFPDDPAYSFGTGDFTVEAFVRFNAQPNTSTTSGMAVLAHYLNIGNQRGWFFRFQTSDELIFAWTTDGIVSQSIVSNDMPALLTGVWYHVAAARQGADMRLFFNGGLLTSSGDPISGDDLFNSSHVIRIGSIGSAGADSWFDGRIDEARITVGKALYTASFTPPADAFPRD